MGLLSLKSPLVDGYRIAVPILSIPYVLSDLKLLSGYGYFREVYRAVLEEEVEITKLIGGDFDASSRVRFASKSELVAHSLFGGDGDLVCRIQKDTLGFDLLFYSPGKVVPCYGQSSTSLEVYDGGNRFSISQFIGSHLYGAEFRLVGSEEGSTEEEDMFGSLERELSKF